MSKVKNPGLAPRIVFLAAAAAVVAAVVVVEAAVAAATAAIAEQQDQNDDPPPVVIQTATETIVITAHKSTSRKFLGVLSPVPWYSRDGFLCSGD